MAMRPVAWLAAAAAACLVVALPSCEGFAEHDLVIGDRNDDDDAGGLVVRRIGDNLTLSCALVAYDGGNGGKDANVTAGEFSWRLPALSVNRSRTIWVENNVLNLFIEAVQPSDAGQYVCASVSGLKTNAFLAVKPSTPAGIPFCSKAMFSCGDDLRCILPSFLCDGRPDCPESAKDEAVETCGSSDPCDGKLKCSDGRCIPKSWCCRHGRSLCNPHPCCSEHVQEDEFIVRTGGGLRKKPNNDSYIMHATLYKACACLFVVITTATILISAICRARLKRISNSQGRIDVVSGSPDSMMDGRGAAAASPGLQDCQYSLVCDNDDESSVEILSQANRYPPSYAEVTAESNRQAFSSDLMIPSSPNRENAGEGTDDQNLQNENQNLQNSPARRPNDFGMGFLANAIFNTWYRPCRTNEIVVNGGAQSMDYPSDSDSSCRSPAIRPNNVPNPGTLEFNSHFYGERIGGTPEVQNTRNWSDSTRRLRHSNALDRILDRFGLNAPYNVDIDRDFNRNTWECRSFLSPPDYSEPRSRRRFFSSIWSRLKNRFSGGDPNQAQTSSSHSVGQFGDVIAGRNRNRRRPDTPDVPESSYTNENASRLASFLNDDAQYEIYGGGFTQIHYFRQRGCFLARDVQIPHNFPPPYSQFALDPPPPYVSRENLVSRDSNGNVAERSADSVRNVANETSPSVSSNSAMEAINSNSCDDNGNVEQPSSTAATQSMPSSSSLGANTTAIALQAHFTNINNNVEELPSARTELQFNSSGSTRCSVDLDALNQNSTYANDDSTTIGISDQVNRSTTSVPNTSTIATVEPSFSADLRRTTDECGLVFPPQNLEYIDSDSNVELI